MGAGNSKEPAASPAGPTPGSSTSDTTSENLSMAAGVTNDATANSNQQTQQQQSASGETSGSKCPMHNSDGSYNWDLRKALFSRTFPHWAGGSKPLSKEEALAATQQKQTTTADEPAAASSEGGCPVKHEPRRPAPPPSSGGGCPVKHSNIRPEYNVYSQPLDPSNQMPSNPNQLPAPTQSKQLSTERVASSIPKGGAAVSDSTWTYPSPQMFYNALARKGKLNDDTAEEDIASVVALHNNMNEKTWQKVLQWEKTITNNAENPKLLKFQGRPTDLSPKAAFKHYVLGHPLPYDRHDWTVERSDGTTARYVIDYYHDETLAREDAPSAHPALRDATASRSLLVDVRPAADDVSLIWSRLVTMPCARRFSSNGSDFEPLPLPPSATMKSQVAESVTVWQNIQAAAKQPKDDSEQQPKPELNITEEQAKELALNFAAMLKDCREAERAVDRCDTAEDCARASLDLTLCWGRRACPVQHGALLERLAADDDAAVDDALQRVGDCVAFQTERHRAAKDKFPKHFS